MTISIVGFSSSAKVPGFYGETVFGAGAINRRGGTRHNALDNAKAQAEHCYRLLKATRK